MRKLLFVFSILMIGGGRVTAADQTLAPVPKMIASEAAETILPEGVIVRIAGSSPADVRIGDGKTPGGIRIGDGGISNTLTNDLNVGAHTINFGGWSLLTLNGWAAITGGEASTTGGVFRLSISGSVFMEAASEVALVQITRFAYVAPYFEIDATAGDASPVIEYSTNLISQTWTLAPVASVTTNDQVVTWRISPTNFSACVYFRASIIGGTASAVDFKATLKEYGKSVATDEELATATGLLWPAVSNRVESLVYTTNSVGSSYITNGVLYLGTNVPAGGGLTTNDLLAAKLACFNDSPQWVYFNSVSYTFPQTEDGSYNWVAPYFNANADTGSIRVPTGATNAVFSLKFGVDSAGTNSIRVSVAERWLKPTGQPTGSDTVGLYNNTFMYTTNIVTFNYPILNSGTNRQGQLMFKTLTPTNGTAFATNGLWVTDVVFQ